MLRMQLIVGGFVRLVDVLGNQRRRPGESPVRSSSIKDRAYMRRSFFVKLACALFLSTSQTALAWDGAVVGYVQGADVTDGPNYAFRIDLAGTPAMCGGA